MGFKKKELWNVRSLNREHFDTFSFTDTPGTMDGIRGIAGGRLHCQV